MHTVWQEKASVLSFNSYLWGFIDWDYRQLIEQSVYHLCCDLLTRICFLIPRNEPRLWSPNVVDEGRAHPFKINLEAEQQVRSSCVRKQIPVFLSAPSSPSPVLPPQEYKPIGTAHNRKAQPFIAAANLDDKRQVVSAAYNTPIGLYSSGNIQDAMEGQIRGLVHPKPERWWLSLQFTNQLFFQSKALGGKNLDWV